MESFIKSLQEYHGRQVFNPWADYDQTYDIGPEAPAIRSANLLRYLQLRRDAKYLFVAEALGYQGGHFTGMAMTSERILLGCHPLIQPQAVLGEWQYQRTSNPFCPLLKDKQRIEGFNEPTATIMWGELAKKSIVPFKALLWNIFPFHPYRIEGLLTNRTPSRGELDTGVEYFKRLRMLLPEVQVIAIGGKSEETLQRYGISCGCVPHPSMGGANRFRAALDELLK